MMKSYYRAGTVTLGILATLATFAVLASSAFGTEFLLNGSPVQAGDAVEIQTELTLTDLKVPLIGEVSILCSFIMDGKFAASKVIEIVEVLELNEIVAAGGLEGVAILCTNVLDCGEPLVYVEHLPWPATVELEGTAFLLDLGNETVNSGMAFDVECMTGALSDLCEGLTLFLVANGSTDVLLEKTLTEDEEENRATELGACTQGGGQAFHVLTDGETLIFDPEGTLQVT